MTLDERLKRAAQEVWDQEFEVPGAPISAGRSRRSRRSGLVVAAGTFLAVVASAATLLWLGPFGDGALNVAGEGAPTSSVSLGADPDGGVVGSPSVESCAPISDLVEAPELSRTRCALTDLLNVYFAAWAGHEADVIVSYFQPPFSVVIGGPAVDSEMGSYEGGEARALVEQWFADGLRAERILGDGGGTGVFHVEAMIYTFGSGEQIHAFNILEFTGDPFTAARQEESPLVTHYIFLLGAETTLTASTVIDHLLNGGTPESFDSLLTATPTTVSGTPTPSTIAGDPATVVGVLDDRVTLADVSSLGAEVAEWTEFNEADGLCSSNIAHVEADSRNRVWAITTCGGVSRWEGDSWLTIFETPAAAGGTRPDTILSDVVLGGVNAQRFSDIDASPAGPVWIALRADVIVFDGEDWSVTEGPWIAPSIIDLAIDANGTPWAIVDDRPYPRDGREVGGLWRFDGEAWRTVVGAPETGQAIAVGADGTVWVATIGALARMDGTGWTRYAWPHPPFEIGYDSESLLVDGFGTVWVIEFVGEGRDSTDVLWALGGDGWRRYEFGRLGGLDVDNAGQLWTASSLGALRSDGSTWTVFSRTLAPQPESGLSGIRDVAIDGDGALWLAATNPNGVLRMLPPNP